jgi:GNAT superfamily N-acetyltransferase
MSGEFTLRVAAADDSRALARLRAQWSGAPERAGELEPRIARWLVAEADRRTVWLATGAAGPAGMVSLLEYRRMPRLDRPDSRWGYIGHLFVSEPLRGRGIATALLAALVTAADEGGYERLVLAPSEQALPLLRRAGFAPADGAEGELLLVRGGAR